MVVRTVDARGKCCPLPIVELSREMKKATIGETVEVLADDVAFPDDVAAWCRKTRNELVGIEPSAGTFRAKVRKVSP
jgi:TusA-related sulfurtransferase